MDDIQRAVGRLEGKIDTILAHSIEQHGEQISINKNHSSRLKVLEQARAHALGVVTALSIGISTIGVVLGSYISKLLVAMMP